MFTAPVCWFAAGICCLALEVLSPVCAFLFFGVGCLAGWLAALLGLDLSWQILAAAAVCLLSLVLFRSRLKKIFSGFSTEDSAEGQEVRPASPLVGQRGVVSAAIYPGHEGQISALGSYWRAAAAEPLSEGQSVVVVEIDPQDALLAHVHRG